MLDPTVQKIHEETTLDPLGHPERAVTVAMAGSLPGAKGPEAAHRCHRLGRRRTGRRLRTSEPAEVPADATRSAAQPGTGWQRLSIASCEQAAGVKPAGARARRLPESSPDAAGPWSAAEEPGAAGGGVQVVGAAAAAAHPQRRGRRSGFLPTSLFG